MDQSPVPILGVKRRRASRKSDILRLKESAKLSANREGGENKRARRIIDYKRPTTFKEETVGISTHEEKMI